MSRTSRREAAEAVPAPVGPEGATPVGVMTLSGVVKTTRGYAVAVAKLKPDGSVESVELKPSQLGKQFVAAQHKQIALSEALKA